MSRAMAALIDRRADVTLADAVAVADVHGGPLAGSI
jgi:hypothetical protein